ASCSIGFVFAAYGEIRATLPRRRQLIGISAFAVLLQVGAHVELSHATGVIDVVLITQELFHVGDGYGRKLLSIQIRGGLEDFVRVSRRMREGAPECHLLSAFVK